MRIGFYAAGRYEDAMIRMSGPAFGLAYISAYLKASFPGQIEEVFMTLDPQHLIDKKPDIAGISAFTYAYGQAIEGAELIRRALPEVPILIGGPHISALPQNLRKPMDIGVLSEGEVPMREIVRLHLANALTPANLRQVPGLVFWNEQGEYEKSACAEQRISDLDMLPHPDREMFRVHWKGEEISWPPSLITSRGCPFTCNFCMYSKSANLVRYHSIDYVMEEIEGIVRDYPTQTHLLISDDLFVTKKSRLKELGDRLREAGLHRRLTFGCMAKASFFDEEYALLLRDMNVVNIAFGFESGSDPVLHYLKDKRSSVAKNQRALELCQQHGIQAGGYFIIGAPQETPADMARTYWFIWRNRTPMPLFGINMLMAMPGTEVWQDTKARGLIDENWEGWDYFTYAALDQGHYFFLNQHYSREFFLEAYEKHFYRLKVKSNDYLALLKCHKVILHQYLEELVLPQIRSKFARGGKLLLVHRGEDRTQLTTLASEYQLTEYRIDQSTELPTGEFDGAVLLHALEYTGFGSSFWQEFSQLNIPSLLISSNPATLARLGSLLSGKGLPYDVRDQVDIRYHYALPQLRAALQPSHQITQLERNRLPRLDTPFGQKIAQLADEGIKPIVRDMARLYEFPLVAHMLQPFHDQQTMQKLRSNLPLDSFLAEADVYSYSLMLQPLKVAMPQQQTELALQSS